MGFWSRLKNLSKPRASGSGRLWDNINSGGVGTHPAGITVSTGYTGTTYENWYQPGPDPAFNLETEEWRNPYRQHSAMDDLQPRWPVREPRTDVGYGFINDDNVQAGSPGQPTVLPPSTLKTLNASPPQTRQRDLLWDAGNPAFIRTPQAYTPSQRYFNARTPLPEFTTPSMPANSVYTNIVYMENTGWEQSLVPEPGMRHNEIGHTPPLLLSAPMHVRTMVGSVEGHRSPIKNAKAPKRNRGGG